MKKGQVAEKQASEMTGMEAVQAFIKAKEIVAAQNIIINTIKGVYKERTSLNGGKLVLGMDDNGNPVGFALESGKGSLSAKGLEAALAKRGVSAVEIASIKAESYGMSETFKLL